MNRSKLLLKALPVIGAEIQTASRFPKTRYPDGF
jgi:hypothetical protein